MLPHKGHEWRAAFPADKLSPQCSDAFDWDTERERVWHELSPGMQATFFGPPPGAEVDTKAPTEPPPGAGIPDSCVCGSARD